MAFTTLEDFLARAKARLDPVAGELADKETLAEGGDLEFVTEAERHTLRPAAVLIPVIPRPNGPTVLLTQRPDTMEAHPGQVAFPGGKIDRGDTDAVAAALREAHEEVGIAPEDVDLIGRSAPYITGTAFRITPVIGVLPPDFVAKPDLIEVAEVFEAPLDFLFRRANHQTGHAFYRGKQRTYLEMPWQGFRIWGVTAGIIRVLCDTLYDTK